MTTTPALTVTEGPVDETGRLLHEGDLAAQLALAVTNLEVALAGHGAGWAEVSHLRVRTTDPDGLALVLDTLAERLEPAGAAPAVSVATVPALPLPGMAVALEGVVPLPPGPIGPHADRNNDMTLPTLTSAVPAAVQLHEALPDLVHLPDTPAYDAARLPWNVAVDQRPAAVALPRTAEEVAAVVREARARGLRIAAQGTGHGAGPMAGRDLSDVLLLRTTGLGGVHVDPVAQVARVGAGVLWEEVVEAAAAHGLAALHGSSPDVGVAGYTLGGGIGWYARKHGLASNSVTAVELVTAAGEPVRADAAHRPDLFWAVRGGGGSFGVVTALELRLFPLADAYAGMMIWPLDRAEAVVRHWAAWCADAPDEVTTSLRAMRFPPLPELPDFLRGRQVLVVDGAVLGDDDQGAALVAGLRALEPELDTFGRVPAAALSRLHMDPEGPTPSAGASSMVARLDEAAVDAFLSAVGPGAETSLLFGELRQLGGALAREPDGAGAVPALTGSHVAFFVGIAATPELAELARADAARAVAAMAPHAGGRTFLNLAEEAVDTRAAYDEGTWRRLAEVRQAYDPDRAFVANHPVGH